ncbi:TerC family protein [Pelagibacterium sp.]|uniref:TerC family protein n=1 Tax=Pelagibacterium sp. TaxID=1967288 RepID=UPI003A925AD4
MSAALLPLLAANVRNSRAGAVAVLYRGHLIGVHVSTAEGNMLEFFIEPAFWASLILLIFMEVVLGTESTNLIANRVALLPEEQQRRAAVLGAGVSTIMRLGLLAVLLWLLGLERVAFSLAGWTPTWGQFVLLGGGLFLIYKAVTELHFMVEPQSVTHEEADIGFSDRPTMVVAQLVALSVVFSADSVVLAVGLTTYVQAIVVAILAAVAILYFATVPITAFLARHAAVRAVAFGILFVVGTVLVAEGLGMPVLRDYLYIAMGIGVLMLGVSKLLHKADTTKNLRPTGAEYAVAPSAAMSGTTVMPIQDRAEPHLEPDLEPANRTDKLPDQEFEPAPSRTTFATDNEPVEPVEPAVVDGPSLEEMIPEGEPPLGEDDAAVQKSPRKKTIVRRRPPRLRTARRRE